ncbi:MAG: hypothetical protein ACI81V_000914 [Lentimonas sp.]|jgi:hypothetical protein
MNSTEISDALQHLGQTEYLYMGGTAITLALLLILLLRRQPKQIVAYVTENGRVMVSRSAIVELVRNTCTQLQVVSKPQVKMWTRGRTSHFNIALKLKESGQLRQVEQALQTRLRQSLTENLGIEKLGQINIIATGFKNSNLKPIIQQSLPSPDPSSTTEEVNEVDEKDYR